MESTANTRSVLRGKLTGFRLFVACVVGALLGFIPGFVNLSDPTGGFMQAPALILALLIPVIVLRCSLITFVITTALAKLLAIQAIGVSYAIGGFLLDGPTSGLFRVLINAPVLAWCGFQYYATTGGLLLGLVVGVAWFLLLRRVLQHRVPEADAAARKLGGPVRLIGIAVVLVAAGGGWLLKSAAGSAAFKNALRNGLEHGNGATVDVAGLDLDLGQGKIVVDGFAMADSASLDVDLFRAQKLEFQVSTDEFLRRRLVIDKITSVAATSGQKRVTPGKRIYPGNVPPPPPPKEGEKTLDDYLEDAKEWEDRLRQVAGYVESMFRSETESETDREKRIEAEKKRLGPENVAATHLVTGAPALLVREISLTGIARAGAPDDAIDIVATNLSTNPSLVDAAAAIKIVTRKKTFGLDLALAKKSEGVRSTFFYTGIPVDKITGQLGAKAASMLNGGTIAVSLDGLLQFKPEGTWIELPLKVALQNTTLAIQGANPTKLDKLELPLGLRGPLSSPRIKFDDSAFADALVAAGKAELANQFRKQAGKLLDGKLGDKLPGEVKGAIGDVISGKGTDAAKKAAEEAAKKVADDAKTVADAAKKAAEDAAAKAAEDARKKAAEDAAKKAKEELEKRLPGGLLGGKKKQERP